MTGRDSWTVLKFGLVCGFVGPALGTLVYSIHDNFFFGKLVSVGVYPSWIAGRVAEAVYDLGMAWMWVGGFGLVLFGPVSAVLGVLGTLVLIRHRERGATPKSLQTRGAGLGAFLGPICALLPPILFSGSPAELARAFVDPERLPYMAAPGLIGLLTGTVLGWAVAFRLSRRPF